ncbi:hypothetical protein EYF80_024216 [Liparis tanakae]|uniref:Uncharacterized protein n=1 Tax=Liparis tanakae TaxID=230148 RepID=A0A4Z2HI84_9TELE|nr:hypothetical protein EYF80_024216 [Liparis tanakae]
MGRWLSLREGAGSQTCSSLWLAATCHLADDHRGAEADGGFHTQSRSSRGCEHVRSSSCSSCCTPRTEFGFSVVSPYFRWNRSKERTQLQDLPEEKEEMTKEEGGRRGPGLM